MSNIYTSVSKWDGVSPLVHQVHLPLTLYIDKRHQEIAMPLQNVIINVS